MTCDRKMQWPAVLSARPLLVYEPHALAVRDAFLEAERRLAGDRASLPAVALTPVQGDAPRWRTVDGVAVVPLSGVLLSRGDFFGEGVAYTSYGAIVREVGSAAADPAVRGIVLAIGSPGGVVEGVLPAASAIREARAAKPVVAHVGSLAASAGYWLAAQADEIVLADDLSQVGSIGVYTLHMDYSRLLTELGIDVTVIASGRHKVDGHPLAPLPDSVRATIQTEVDDLRLMFARAVADGRPVLFTDLALATEARVFRALDPRTGEREAITHKLADRVERLDRVIGELSRAPRPTRRCFHVRTDRHAGGRDAGPGHGGARCASRCGAFHRGPAGGGTRGRPVLRRPRGGPGGRPRRGRDPRHRRRAQPHRRHPRPCRGAGARRARPRLLFRVSYRTRAEAPTVVDCRILARSVPKPSEGRSAARRQARHRRQDRDVAEMRSPDGIEIACDQIHDRTEALRDEYRIVARDRQGRLIGAVPRQFRQTENVERLVVLGLRDVDHRMRHECPGLGVTRQLVERNGHVTQRGLEAPFGVHDFPENRDLLSEEMGALRGDRLVFGDPRCKDQNRRETLFEAGVLVEECPSERMGIFARGADHRAPFGRCPSHVAVHIGRHGLTVRPKGKGIDKLGSETAPQIRAAATSEVGRPASYRTSWIARSARRLSARDRSEFAARANP